VPAVKSLQAARFRDRLGVSGAKRDAGDAHVLADMVRSHAHELRPVAGDSTQAEAIKVVARTHKTLIWERTRHTQRLRNALRDYFPAALVAFEDLDAADALELVAKAPTSAQAARLTTAQISAALKRARKNVAENAAAIQAALRAEHLGQPEVVASAYAASVQALIAVLTVLNTQVKVMQGHVRPILASTRPLDRRFPSRSGCGPRRPGARRVRRRVATPPPRPARTMPGPPRSPARPARRRSPWPGRCTTGSSTPSPPKRSTHCCDRPERAPTTTGSEPAAAATDTASEDDPGLCGRPRSRLSAIKASKKPRACRGASKTRVRKISICRIEVSHQ
jgi:hypothetical protein